MLLESELSHLGLRLELTLSSLASHAALFPKAAESVTSVGMTKAPEAVIPAINAGVGWWSKNKCAKQSAPAAMALYAPSRVVA